MRRTRFAVTAEKNSNRSPEGNLYERYRAMTEFRKGSEVSLELKDSPVVMYSTTVTADSNSAGGDHAVRTFCACALAH